MKSVSSMIHCALFSALIAVGAFIKLPLFIVPMTLQTLFVMLAGMMLGKKEGTLSVGIYLFCGLIGFPIFANGGGISYFLQPTFGYLLGFIPAVYLLGWLNEKTKIKFLHTCAALFVIYVCGIGYFELYFYMINGSLHSLNYILTVLVLPFLIGDVLSCYIAYYINQRLRHINLVKN